MALGPASGGGGGKSGDVRAGGAYVEISARDRLSSSLVSIKAKAKAFATGLASIGKSITFVGAAALTPLAALFGAGVNRAGEIDKLAESLGFTIEQMQRIKYAADVAGVSLDEVLSKPEKYKGLMASATVLDAGTIRDAVAAQEAMRSALLDLQIAVTPLVSTFVPLVKAVSEFIKQNSDMVRVLAVGAAGMTALGLATFGVGKSLLILGAMVKPVVAIVGLLFTKIGLGIAVVGALGAAVLTMTTSGRNLADGLGQTFTTVGNTFSGMLKGVIDALKAGEFKKAFEIFTLGIEEVWYEMIAGMARAFAKFVSDNHDNLIAIGALMGGVEGGKLGRFFGPVGAAIGIAAGAAAGGIGADQLAKLLEKIGDTSSMDALAAEAKAKIEKLKKEVAPPAIPPVNEESLPKRITAVRGAFRKLLDSNQQFGGSDALRTDQKLALEQLKKVNQNLEQLNNNMRLK